MYHRPLLPLFLLLAISGTPLCGLAEDLSSLRLIPFPKEIESRAGSFPLATQLVLETPPRLQAVLHSLLKSELQRAGCGAVQVRCVNGEPNVFRLIAVAGDHTSSPADPEAGPESYRLEVLPSAIVCHGGDEAGLFYGMQTLCQLIRCNRTDGGLPCLRIRDWPALRWRCFQDDLTRGPSSTLDTLRQHIDLGASLKMNLFTYYMEYQYGFHKHPQIGPPNGSLQPEELTELVQYAKTRQTDILGNQQSFGHFTWILKHPEFAELRETEYLLSPAVEGTYQLLDDLYSEVCPLLPFEMFNVCCDETFGLGNGPSRQLAEEIGVGGVYVRHIRRLHDLLRDKYQKRMMMWGDIILEHPDKLDQIPKDTIMLTWGYAPQASFDDQIVPFRDSGYEFFVCPGINNWSRILPDFGATVVNIGNFVRDGIEHGALGMLNTAWEDDGEALQGYKWHGYAWGAECAWNGSRTSPEDFARRIGGVLFGEPGDHFGQAIALLSETHGLPGMRGMLNARFWENDFVPRQSVAATRRTAEQLLQRVSPAIEHLEACRQEATCNAELLDAFLLGARRMELIGRRMLAGLQACELYAAACDATDVSQRTELLEQVRQIVEQTRQSHAALGQEFQRIWLSESKPYALDWTTKRYEEVDRWYAALSDRLTDAIRAAEAGNALPTPADTGLALPTCYSRQTRPHAVVSQTLRTDAPWAVAEATHRIGLIVQAGNVTRYQLPVEVDVALPDDLTTRPVQAFWLRDGEPALEILAQLDRPTEAGAARTTLMLPGPLPPDTEAQIHVYCGLPRPPESIAGAAATSQIDDSFWQLQNATCSLLLGKEGAHIYGWQVPAAGNRDLTMPGHANWSGFADLGHPYRSAENDVQCVAQGPALVRYVCRGPHSLEKTISLFGGVSWLEVVLTDPVQYYWDFDNPLNFAADSPTPGTYLFANGATGPVGRAADQVAAQVKADQVRWAVKWSADKLALGLATPEVATRFVVGPGDGAGGVGIEGGVAASHFVTYAGQLEQSPAETMQRLATSLDFANQARVIVHGLEQRP
jgi:hypothetical protein